MTTSGVDRLILDTSAYSYFRRGHEGVLSAMASAERVLIPMIVLGELEAAFEFGTRARENRRSLEDFIEEPFVDLLPVTRSTARQYGRTFAALRRAGTPVPVNDVWIAAASIDCGGTLLTFDRHFEQVPGLNHILLQ